MVIAFDRQIKKLKDIREDLCKALNESIDTLLKMRARALEAELELERMKSEWIKNEFEQE